MSNVWVIDACVAAKWWLNDEEYIAEAVHVLKAVRRKEIELAVPTLWLYEMANVIVQAHRQKRLTKQQAEEFILEVHAMPVLIYPVYENLSRIANLALRHSLSAYDAAYLALAESRGCGLLTADEALFKTIGRKFAFVHPLKEAKRIFRE
jgi:predicted nucleic acid-binding protein